MKTPKEIEDFLNDQFNDFEVKPGSSSLNQFLNKLETAKEKKRRRAAFYIFLSGVAAVLLILLGAYFSSLMPVRNQNKTLSATKTRLIKKQLQFEETTKLGKNASATKKTEKAILNPISPKGETNLSMVQKPELSDPLKNTTKTNTSPVLKNPGSASDPADMLNNAPGDTDPSFDRLKNSNSDPAVNSTLILQHNVVLFPEHLALIQNTPPADRSLMSGSEIKAEEDLLQFRSLPLKARLFAGIGLQALISNSFYSENKGSTINKTGYTGDFNASYIQQRQQNKTQRPLLIPGLKIGVIVNRYEIYTGLGYYQLTDRETVRVPKDSLTMSGSGATLGALGSGNGTTTGTFTGRVAGQDVVNEQTYTNRFSYLYAGLGVNAVFQYYAFSLKPGINISYNRITRGNYVLVDTDGYKRLAGSVQHLNKHVFSASINCSFAKKINRNIEVQLSPVYRMSLSSIFDSHYFNSQTYRAFGLEGALIYKFPVKFKP